MTQLPYTTEELELLGNKLSAAYANVPPPYNVTSEEDIFLNYISNLTHIVKTVEPRSWGLNEVFNDDEGIQEPKDLSILTDPLWKMPLNINDPRMYICVVAAWRLEIAR
jgi:hypothetical protein